MSGVQTLLTEDLLAVAEQGVVLTRQAREELVGYERSLLVAALAASRQQAGESRQPPVSLETKLQHLERICDELSHSIKGLNQELRMRFEASGAEQPATGLDTTLKKHLADYERRIIQVALRRCGMNQVEASRILGLRPTTLSEKMKKLGLRGARQSCR